ncbi:MAG: TonB C-terminal domain-containing protein [Nitrospirae bacterium]|nr:TonB C-terminal domain-containing protein [Nitrospirota bacterium]
MTEADRLARIQQLEKRRKLRESALAEKQIETPRPAAPAASVVSAEEMAVYEGIITNRVRQRWVFTGKGAEGLSAEVLIALDRNGSVRTQKITRGSGNVEFDRSVLRAIAKASPFPPPPDGADTEIQFRFRSKEDLP